MKGLKVYTFGLGTEARMQIPSGGAMWDANETVALLNHLADGDDGSMADENQQENQGVNWAVLASPARSWLYSIQPSPASFGTRLWMEMAPEAGSLADWSGLCLRWFSSISEKYGCLSKRYSLE